MDERGETLNPNDREREYRIRLAMLLALAQGASFGDTANLVIPPYLFFDDYDNNRRGE